MKIELVFDDWRDKNHESIYNTAEGIALSGGDFHSGATFRATIEVDDPEKFERQLHQGFVPVFYVLPIE